MFKFVLNRVFSSVITIILIITITFALMHSIPGDPLTRDKEMPEQIRQNLMEKYHLDEPLWKQYFIYLKGLATGDMGISMKYQGVTVNEIIAESFPISAQLGLVAIAIMLLIGIPAGIISALRQNKWQDHLAMFLATLGVAIPNFVLATLLIYIFGVKLGWLPTSRWVSWKSVIMPSIALAGYSAAYIARLTRSSVLEVIQQDYIRTAKAKGLPERVVVYKHALKNALIPIVTYLGPLTAGILTGSFVVEKIFAIPGLGQYFVNSISNRDYTVILGVTVFYASFLVFMNMIVDIVYGFIDPRIRVGK
ncbi:MAG: ABC transporter permease [Desulfotomaculum sp.]|nr:ABC transporter permease [Desulfotomaculum sp.]